MRTIWIRAALATALIAACAGRVPGLGNGDGVPSPGPQRPADGQAQGERPGRPAGHGENAGNRKEAAKQTGKQDGAQADEDGKQTGEEDARKAGKEARKPGPAKTVTAVVPFLVVPRFFLPEPSTIEQARLFLYDEVTTQVYALPGAGVGTLGPSYFGDRFVLFYKLEGGIFAYDTVSETVVAFNDVFGWLSSFRPSISGDGRTMVFLADPPGVPPVKGMFGREPTEFTKAYMYRDGAVGELAVINAVARMDGGIDRMKIAGNGQVIAFSTNLGGVYVYTIGAEIALLAQSAPARDPALSSDGSVLAWATGRGSEPRRLHATVVSTRSEPIEEPTHEAATQTFVPPWYQPGAAKAGATEGPPAARGAVVFYRPTHPAIPLAEVSLAVGPRVVSFSASNDRLTIVSYDETHGFFRWWRHVFAGDFLELLTVLNLASFTASPLISDVAGSD